MRIDWALLSSLAFTAAFTALMASSLSAQENDAQFVLLGKTMNHRQSSEGELTFLNTTFFGEIFLEKGGTVTNGYVIGPGDAAEGMHFGEGEVLFFAADRYGSVDELNQHFPEGTYYFHFDTPRGNMRGLPVVISSNGMASRHPGPIELTLYQNDEVADPDTVDPDRDLRVVWSEFTNGATDADGIIDDMIYAMMADCFGEETVHSGHAFEPQSFTYKQTELLIPKEKLHAGQVFQIEVEFSEMDTGRYREIPTIVTHAASTFLDIRTNGTDTQGKACPALPYAMDGGQTDRERRPQ